MDKGNLTTFLNRAKPRSLHVRGSWRDDEVRSARLRTAFLPAEIELLEPLLDRIDQLRRERNAVVLAHNYQTPDIYFGAADLTGDSLAIARAAQQVEAEVIVLCGVYFMAETVKILNPDRMVLIPDVRAGCSLASSITGHDVRDLKAKYPGVPVVVYVNTSAEVKAEADYCCTSGNAVSIVNAIPSDKIIFLPDEYLGKWVASQVSKELILWNGHCEVHERFNASDIASLRQAFPELHVIAHPECPPEVLEASDFVGSTAGMVRHLGQLRPKRVAMLTECSMSDNVAVEFPDIEFVRPCNLCPHMKRITLQKIVDSLEHEVYQVEVPSEVAGRARASVERMLQLSSKPQNG